MSLEIVKFYVNFNVNIASIVSINLSTIELKWNHLDLDKDALGNPPIISQ